MNAKPEHFRGILIAVTCAATVAVTACGGGSNGTSGTSGNTAATGSTSTTTPATGGTVVAPVVPAVPVLPGSPLAPVSPSAPVAQASQTRKLRGFDVQLTPYVVPGTAFNQPTQIQFVVTNPLLIASVTAASGDDYDTAVPVMATQSSSSPSLWSIDWPKSSVPESGLLLTFKLKDGDTLETGASDFRFK